MEVDTTKMITCSSVCLFAGVINTLSYKAGIVANYGKHTVGRKRSVDAKLAWILQELPSVLIPFLLGIRTDISSIHLPNLIIAGLFTLHYFQRTFIYTCLMSKRSTPVPLTTMLMGVLFTSLNGYAISGYEFSKEGSLPKEWVFSLQFIGGVLIWTIGFLINLHSDNILRNLRKPNETGHKIPQGGLFEYVSAANYFGEIVEWNGLAIASRFHFPTTAFALATILVIGTRGLGHHQFYLNKFKNYPRKRKAVIPFLL